jgi:hypothetical protein
MAISAGDILINFTLIYTHSGACWTSLGTWHSSYDIWVDGIGICTVDFNLSLVLLESRDLICSFILLDYHLRKIFEYASMLLPLTPTGYPYISVYHHHHPFHFKIFPDSRP